MPDRNQENNIASNSVNLGSVAGRDLYQCDTLNINTTNYKPCSYCRRSWIELDMEVCEPCIELIQLEEKKQKHIKNIKRLQLFVGLCLFLTVALTLLTLYITKAENKKNIFHIIENFNNSFYISLFTSLCIVSLGYISVFLYARLCIKNNT